MKSSRCKLRPAIAHKGNPFMSFFTVEPAPARLNRSELAVPGSQPQLFEKAAKSAADVIFLDLEDAVAPDDKEKARKNVIAAVGDIDWGRKNSLGPDQRPRHPLHVPRRRRPARTVLRTPRPHHDPQGWHRGRRLRHRYALYTDRIRQGPQEEGRLRDDHRDRARHAECPRHRRRLQAQRIAPLWRSRLCRLHQGPHHLDRRRQSRLCRVD